MATGSKNDLQKRPSSLKISDSNVAVESGDEENHSLSCQVNNHHKAHCRASGWMAIFLGVSAAPERILLSKIRKFYCVLVHRNVEI